MRLEDLRSPCALVDASRVSENCRRMARHIAALGARLRPHVKTHKSVEAARLQVQGHFGGITVSTLAEARFFAQAGFSDITYAVPLAPNRVHEALELQRGSLHLQVLVDDSAPVDSLLAHRLPEDAPFPVFLKLDCGYGRAGVSPEGEDGLRLAERLVTEKGIDFRGILSHAGHSYDAGSIEEVREIARQERAVTVAYGERLRAAGLPCPEVSIGSTPTCVHTEDLSGVTEVRPGNYSFFDLFQARLGSCEVEDIALSVLATVIGSYPERKQLIIDAGALALSKDAGAQHLDPDCGFGQVCDLGGQRLQGLQLSSLSQEHGVVVSKSGDFPAGLGVGSRVRILPNHACLTAACHDSYHQVEGDQVVGRWTPVRGW